MSQLAALIAIAYLGWLFVKTAVTPTEEERHMRETLRRYHATKPPTTLKEILTTIALILGTFITIIFAMAIAEVYGVH